MKSLKLLACQALLAMASVPAHAGVDLYGVVHGIQIRPDGSLWFGMTPSAGQPPTTNFCAPGWWDLNMFIPPSNPQYAYYYGMLMTSMTKNKVIGLPNISTFSGTTSCDITQTGYGIVLRQ